MKGLGILIAAMTLTYGTSIVMQKPGSDYRPSLGVASANEAGEPVVITKNTVLAPVHAMRCSERIGYDGYRNGTRTDRGVNPCASM